MAIAHILVVDDDRSIVRLCQKILERAEFEVSVGNSAEEAIGILRTEKIDLLLVDFRMPDMDGFELSTKAREIRPGIAILLMTGHGTVETAITALHRGIDGLILKPFESMEDLVEKCKEILVNQQQRKNADRLEALRPIFNISESLIGETNPETLVKLVSGAISGMLRSFFLQIYIQAEKKDELDLIENLGESDIWLQVAVRQGPLKKIILEGIPVVLNKDEIEEQELKNLLIDHQIKSLLIAPVQSKNNRYIYLAARSEGEKAFRDSDFETFVILVRQSTVALENARLYEDLRLSLKKLEESQRAVIQAEKMAAAGRLLASVAHEINNPLQSVRNCLVLADKESQNSGEQRKYLQLAQDEVTRLAGTVTRMLEFYQTGKIEKEVIVFPSVVEKVITLIKPQMRDRFIQLIPSIPLNLPVIYGSADQLQQVVFNLLINAMEALDEVRSNRKIWLESVFQDGSICLWVEDSGFGILPELENKIFDPFISSKKNGTGLGLSVCYNIILGHGGTIRIIPPVHGNGARFEVRLPVRMEASQ